MSSPVCVICLIEELVRYHAVEGEYAVVDESVEDDGRYISDYSTGLTDDDGNTFYCFFTIFYSFLLFHFSSILFTISVLREFIFSVLLRIVPFKGSCYVHPLFSKYHPLFCLSTTFY